MKITKTLTGFIRPESLPPYENTSPNAVTVCATHYRNGGGGRYGLHANAIRLTTYGSITVFTLAPSDRPPGVYVVTPVKRYSDKTFSAFISDTIDKHADAIRAIIDSVGGPAHVEADSPAIRECMRQLLTPGPIGGRAAFLNAVDKAYSKGLHVVRYVEGIGFDAVPGRTGDTPAPGVIWQESAAFCKALQA